MNSDLKAQLRELNITAAKARGAPGVGFVSPRDGAGSGTCAGRREGRGRSPRLTASVLLFALPHQESEVGGGRKAIIIFVPVTQLKSFQKIQVRLVRELETKFSGKHVVFIAQVRPRARRVGSLQ